jgi:hypothetical protein
VPKKWKLKTLERNYAGKEKGLDIEIALDMNTLPDDDEAGACRAGGVAA